MVVFVTKRELEDEDLKTHIAQGKERIPAGAKVELVKRMQRERFKVGCAKRHGRPKQ